MPRDLTALVTTTEAAARVLTRYQINPEDFFERLGLGPTPYADPDARLDLKTVQRLWREFAKQTHNPEIGFEIGMAVTATNLHAIGYACLASRTGREVLERINGDDKLDDNDDELLKTIADDAFEAEKFRWDTL